MLEIRQLCIQYGKRQILKQADLWADIGLTCIIGESGSGKSSILNALMDHIDHQCETYRVNGCLLYTSRIKSRLISSKRFRFLKPLKKEKRFIVSPDDFRVYAFFWVGSLLK